MTKSSINGSTKSKKRGRPVTTGKGEPVMVRLLPELMTPLDNLIAAQGGESSRPEAIRKILAEHFRRKGITPKRPKP